MPWHQHRQASSKADTAFVAAGDASGALHVWAGSGTGQHTWQKVHVSQQVSQEQDLYLVERNARHCFICCVTHLDDCCCKPLPQMLAVIHMTLQSQNPSR